MKDLTQPHHTVPVHGSVLSRFLFFFSGVEEKEDRGLLSVLFIYLWMGWVRVTSP